MPNFNRLILFFLLFSCSTQAAFVTDTDIFILSNSENRILKINRITQDETIYQLPENSDSFHVYENCIFSYTTYSNRVHIISLGSGALIGQFNLPDGTLKIQFYKDTVLVHVRGKTSLCRYRLHYTKKLSSIDFPCQIKQFFVHQEKAYVISEIGDLFVLDLQTLKLKNTNSSSHISRDCIIRFIEGKLYALNHEGLWTYSLDDFSVARFKPIRFLYPNDIYFHKKAIYGCITHHLLQKFDIETMKEVSNIKMEALFVISGHTDNYLFLKSVGLPYEVYIVDVASMSIIKKIKSDRNLTLDVSDTHYYLGVKKLDLRYFKSPDHAYSEAETIVKGYLDTLESSMYKDVLSPADIKALMDDIPPSDALAAITSLHQPKTFIETAEGKQAISRIITAYGKAFLAGDTEAKLQLFHIIMCEVDERRHQGFYRL